MIGLTAEAWFQVSNLVAICGWLIMIFFYQTRLYSVLIERKVLPLSLSGLYLGIAILHFGDSLDFSSIDSIQKIFQNDWALLAGWVHYLAFDLLVGEMIFKDSQERGISRWLISPFLFFTFFLGPVGFLAYRLLRERLPGAKS